MRRRLHPRILALAALLTIAFTPFPLNAEVLDRGDEEGQRPDPDERPFVVLLGGLASIERDATAADFADRGLLGLRIGFSKERRLAEDETVRRFSARNLFVERSSSEPADASEEEIETSAWRFGLSDTDGEGYRIGTGALTVIGTHAGAMGWSFIDLEEDRLEETDPNAYRRIDPFLDHVRFGTSWRGGLRISPHRNLAVQADYQRAILFPATKGLDLILSNALEAIALAAIDPFLAEVAERAPRAVPVLGFLFRGGILYGLYELRQENMHWPLDTAPPLSDDSFRFGIEVVF
ncbi:MAG: hypothetical protein GF346_12000 [Candidatus Eisenbacteria bacterium]|nr:hypothetical protein [Candidatus Latescibacterota bacterium]MBD3303159.1 hypothetical protein [Candidatus Eisenbacteria bacterium]